MNEDQTPEAFRAKLIEDFEDLSEALPDLDLKSHLEDDYEAICEIIAQIQIESEVIRRQIIEKLGVSENAS